MENKYQIAISNKPKSWALRASKMKVLVRKRSGHSLIYVSLHLLLYLRMRLCLASVKAKLFSIVIPLTA